MGASPKNPVTGLTAKEEAFAFEVVRLGNANRAYRVAYDAKGMSAGAVRSEVWRLVRKPEIEERMREHQAVFDAKLDVKIERIAKELARVAFADMGDLYDDEGRAIPFAMLPEDVRRAVQSITVTERQGGMLINVKGEKVSKAGAKALRAKAKEGDAPAVEYVALRDKRIQLHDKLGALQTLARWKKMIQDRGEDGAVDPNDVRGLTDEQLEDEIRANQEALAVIDKARGRKKAKEKQPSKAG